MRLIQLSDIHLSQNNLDSLKRFYIEALKKDLATFNETKPIDLILITGDLVDKGGSSFKNRNPYDVFTDEFITPILNHLNLSKDRVLFIPGNHDIDRNEIDKIYEDGLIKNLSTIDTVNAHVTENKENFNSSNKRIQKFKEFENNYHKKTKNYTYTNNESIYIHNHNDYKIGFLLVNDSWRCSESLKVENHYVGVEQLFNAKTIFEDKNTDINIVLFHHPLDFFNEEERREIKNILQKFNFELVLCGHTHKSHLNSNHGVNGNVLFLNAKSAFNNPREDITNYQPGYHIIDITPDSLELKCHCRTYIHNRFEFDKDTNSARDGFFSHKLVPKDCKKEHYELYDLVNKTNLNYVKEFNNALVIFKTDTIAPKDVNHLFVLPKLTERQITLGIIDDDELYTLDKLVLDEQSILLFGSKESGKTTLLNKLSILCSNQFNQFKKIPIVLDYKTLVKSDVLISIKKYLNETKEKVEKLLNNGQIILLLDNIIEGDKYKHAQKHFHSFITEFPNNKIIATTSENFDELIQNPNSTISKFLFKPIFIGPVGVNEFRELATKWFDKEDSEWHTKNINNLINTFKILRIPRTFFSVSLFLWIIEKQEGFKPVNKNYLLNKFLQFVLEGLQSEEVKSGSFNFDRKKEILAEIAYSMYNNGNELENYSLLKVDVINVISTYFSKNQRNNDPLEVYEIFYQKGIFKTGASDEKVSFRFESFFQFFLSLNIETNKDFQNKVFSEAEVLSFINELDYYSGRHQNDKTTLVFVKDILLKSFEELDKFIEDDTDKYFPKKSIILGDIDTDTFYSNIKDKKLTNQEINEVLDDQMSVLPVNDSISIKRKYDYKTHFPMTLELAARILKNAENIQDPALVNETLGIIIQKTAKYSIYMQSSMIQYFKENEGSELPISPEILVCFTPVINQLMLLEWIGTEFLQIPLQNKIKKHLINRKNLYECFIANSIYSDLKLHDYIKYTNQAIKQIDNKYFAELYFFKILIHYMMRPQGSSLIPILEDQMIKLLRKIKGYNKLQARSVVENGIREKKKNVKFD